MIRGNRVADFYCNNPPSKLYRGSAKPKRGWGHTCLVSSTGNTESTFKRQKIGLPVLRIPCLSSLYGPVL